MNVQEFLDLYESKGTQKVYRCAINLYFNTLQADPKNYFKPNRDYKQDINKFKQALQERPPKTMHSYLMGVKQYLLENDIPVEQIFKKQRRRERKLKKVMALTEDYIPTNEELRQLLSHAKIKDRALILCLLSSGMRIGELLHLKTQDIHLKEAPARVVIQADYTKNGQKRTTFLSNEAVECLKEWIKVKDVYETTAGLRHYNHKKNSEQLFPMSYGNVIQSWNRLLVKSGLDMKDQRTKRYQLHPHNLRKVYRTKLPAFIGVDMTETLLGHSGYLTEEYRRFNDKELGEAYLKGMNCLSVFQVETDLTEVNTEIKGLKDENQKLRNYLQDFEIEMRKMLREQDKREGIKN